MYSPWSRGSIKTKQSIGSPLQVVTGLLRFREREEGQNQIRWWTENEKKIRKYKNLKKAAGKNFTLPPAVTALTNLTSALMLRMPIAMVTIMGMMVKGKKDDDDYDNDVSIDRPPTQQAYGMQSSRPVRLSVFSPSILSSELENISNF